MRRKRKRRRRRRIKFFVSLVLYGGVLEVVLILVLIFAPDASLVFGLGLGFWCPLVVVGFLKPSQFLSRFLLGFRSSSFLVPVFGCLSGRPQGLARCFNDGPPSLSFMGVKLFYIFV